MSNKFSTTYTDAEHTRFVDILLFRKVLCDNIKNTKKKKFICQLIYYLKHLSRILEVSLYLNNFLLYL